jgi:hypothetical protein
VQEDIETQVAAASKGKAAAAGTSTGSKSKAEGADASKTKGGMRGSSAGKADKASAEADNALMKSNANVMGVQSEDDDEDDDDDDIMIVERDSEPAEKPTDAQEGAEGEGVEDAADEGSLGVEEAEQEPDADRVAGADDVIRIGGLHSVLFLQ